MFPFPLGLTPRQTQGMPLADKENDLLLPPVGDELLPAAIDIASAAKRLVDLRNNWLNPADWVTIVPEVVEGYPARFVPKPEHEAELKKRTLTNLYNQKPAWLVKAHEKLDIAVATSYGWKDYTSAMSDEEILRRLLVLNLERSKAEPTSAKPQPKTERKTNP